MAAPTAKARSTRPGLRRALSAPSLVSPASISPSRTFGWWGGCENGSTCYSQVGALLGVSGVSITAEEDTEPSIVAVGSNNVWYTGTFSGNPTRWIRGIWPASVLDTDPSGVCDMTAGFDSQLLQGPSVAPDRHVWDQCDPRGAQQQWGFNIDTTGIPSGVVPYALSAKTPQATE
jgi:hypothetical protein